MKITDIIRSVLDIVDGAQAPAEPVVAIKITAEPEADLMDMQRLAGILADPEYANEPNTVVAQLQQHFLQVMMYITVRIPQILEPMHPACTQAGKLPNKENQ